MAENKLHLITQHYEVNREQREGLNSHKSKVLWFTGLSGSGKSTLANLLECELHERGIKTYILDGDNVRMGLNKDLDFSESGRVENIRRIAEVSKLFIDAGVVVLTAFISPFRSDRAIARSLSGTDNFVEIFVDCPLEICEQRDIKGLYKKARNGEIKNFTGIDSPFEEPENPEIKVATHIESTSESLEKILNYILPLLKI
jgi:adenylylsulfate kinase